MPPMPSTGTDTARTISASPSTPSQAVLSGLEIVGNTLPAMR